MSRQMRPQTSNEVLVKKDESPEEILETSEEVPKAPVQYGASESDSIVKVDPVAGGIEVMATRPGFYKNCRKVEGDIFSVPDMSKVGSWMKCTEPKAEAERKKLLAAKKKAAGL